MSEHQGKTYIEDEFRSLMLAIYPGQRVGAHQLREMRQAFFAGALAFQTIIMSRTTPGDDVTPADDDLMETLQAELDAFGRELLARVMAGRVEGSA